MDNQEEQALLEKLRSGVINFDEDLVREAAREVLARGFDPRRAVFEGLVAGIEEVGRLYEEQVYFVPEMLLCADALYAGLEILRPHLKREEASSKGKVIIGVVEGDVHDIGKNLVKIMLDAAGFEIIDLGRDVPLDRFVTEQEREGADLICLSAMMTTTMGGMQEVIRRLKAANPGVRIMVGGAPLSEDLAQKWGADGYAPDANNALKEAVRLVRSLRALEEKGAL